MSIPRLVQYRWSECMRNPVIVWPLLPAPTLLRGRLYPHPTRLSATLPRPSAPGFAPACLTVARPSPAIALLHSASGAHLWTLVTFLQVRCGSASRVWRCGVSVSVSGLCGAIAWLGARSVRNAHQQTFSQPAKRRYSNSGVQPAAHSSPAIANCLPSSGVWESAAPGGTSPTCLNTVPSHTQPGFTSVVAPVQNWRIFDPFNGPWDKLTGLD